MASSEKRPFFMVTYEEVRSQATGSSQVTTRDTPHTNQTLLRRAVGAVDASGAAAGRLGAHHGTYGQRTGHPLQQHAV